MPGVFCDHFWVNANWFLKHFRGIFSSRHIRLNTSLANLPWDLMLVISLAARRGCGSSSWMRSTCYLVGKRFPMGRCSSTVEVLAVLGESEIPLQAQSVPRSCCVNILVTSVQVYLTHMFPDPGLSWPGPELCIVDLTWWAFKHLRSSRTQQLVLWAAAQVCLFSTAGVTLWLLYLATKLTDTIPQSLFFCRESIQLNNNHPALLSL